MLTYPSLTFLWISFDWNITFFYYLSFLYELIFLFELYLFFVHLFDILIPSGYIFDIGRVLTSSGTFLRNRSNDSDHDFVPFGSSSLLSPIPFDSSSLGFAFAANSNNFSVLPSNTLAPFVCERIGLFCGLIVIYFNHFKYSFLLKSVL